MAKHHPDLIMCRKQPGIAIGHLCEKCDGKCVICDSYVRPCTLVRVCDECNYGSFQGRCVICGGVGISDAYYCKECTQQEKDRDGCPKIVNLGSAKTDLFYERKKYGFKKRWWAVGHICSAGALILKCQQVFKSQDCTCWYYPLSFWKQYWLLKLSLNAIRSIWCHESYLLVYNLIDMDLFPGMLAASKVPLSYHYVSLTKVISLSSC